MTATRAFDEVIDFLAGHDPQRVIDFHPSEKTQDRVELLLHKKREDTLTDSDKSELEYFLMLEHIMRMAKAKAMKSLQK